MLYVDVIYGIALVQLKNNRNCYGTIPVTIYNVLIKVISRFISVYYLIALSYKQ
jgi:hypothetical protein